MKYRKRPVVIEAFQLCVDEAPQWFLTSGDVLACPDSTCIIKTLEGDMKADKGDYIIKGVNGELYPCKEDIFHKTYQKAVDDDPEKKWCMSLRSAVQAVMGTLYAQSPYHIPRKADIICQKFQDAFKKDAKLYQDFYFYEMKDKDVYGFFEKLLKDIPEFVELNLSKVEYEKGIKVDDPSRPPFGCVSRDSWIKEEHDFVDLDAAVRNVVRLYFQVEDDEREFLL